MAKLEKLETNKVKLTFDISKEKIQDGTNKAYNKNKSRFHVPGFRKGKVPKKMIELQYGKDVFFEDAVNFCLPEAYKEAVMENTLEVVSKPIIDIENVSEDGVVTLTAEVYTKPEIEISEYKGLKYQKLDDTVSEEEINKVIDEDRERNARIITVEDRPVVENDIVSIDFEGFVDGVTFEGGTGKDYELTIGSKMFVDNFEEQLIGHKIGESVEVNITFPENYGNEDLANKPALFKVVINEIKYKELPDIDEDFVQDVSEFDTLDEYKNSIRENLSKEKQDSVKLEKEKIIMDKVIENSTIELPEVMVESQIDNMVSEFENRLHRQGLDLETYLGYFKQDRQQFGENYREQARRQVLGRLALEYIVDKEGIIVSEEDIDNEIGRIAESYNIEKEKLSTAMHEEDKKNIAKDLKIQKALELVLDSAIEE